MTSLLTEKSLSDDAQRDYPSVRCTMGAHFEDGVLIDWVLYAKRPTEFSISGVAIEHSSVSSFLLAAVIPARRCVYVNVSMNDAETLQRIGWYRAALAQCRLSFPSCRAASWQRKLSSARAVASECFCSARRMWSS